jgi:glycolate oxidase iron-sulfur subunit
MAARAGRLAKPLAGLLPSTLRAMLDLLPEHLPGTEALPARYPTEGKVRARVALLVGCAQQVLAPEINWATLRVLTRNGIETLIPQGQGCCGSLALHDGEARRARLLASRNFPLFPADVDAIVTTAAGCGSGMKEYPLLFAGTSEEERAREFASRVKDVSQFLFELGAIAPPALPEPLVVVYHDACHLAHAQGIREAPRALLEAIPNLTLREVRDGHLCCGSAGSYNLSEPAIARELGERKARALLESGAEVIVTGNIGCMTQITHHLALLDSPLPILHTMQLLEYAHIGRSPVVQ